MFSHPNLTNYFLINIIIIVNFIKIKTEKRKIDSLNEITIKIKGKGEQNVLNSQFIFKPNEILLNGNPTIFDEENKIYILENEENEENLITLKWDTKLIICQEMFRDLNNIIEIDLSNFDMSEIISMGNMFGNCSKVKNIIIKNKFGMFKLLDTSNMFYNCISLRYLDLSDFNTSLVTNMALMFRDCISLTSINLSNFDTSSCLNMGYMFESCILLESLDLSSFETSNVIFMTNLFNNCTSLKSINLSSFNTLEVGTMSQMFSYCISLESLDISKFDTQKVINMNAMFYNCNKLISLDLSNFDTSKSNKFNLMFYECNNLISLDISNFHFINQPNIDFIFYNCKSLEYLNLNNVIEEVDPNITDIFYNVSENIVYCLSNEENLPNILSELKKKKCPINDCSNNWKINQKKYINEKNICLNECKEDNEYFYQFKNKCYNNCPEGTHSLYYNNNTCIIDCPYNIPFEKNNECNIHCSASDFFNNLCVISNQTLQAKEYMINTIINDIASGLMDSLLLDNLNNKNESLIIKEKEEIYQITYSDNLNNNDISTINLGECENLLKEKYNIPLDKNLIIFKMEYFIEEFLIPIIEYEVFHPDTKTLLDLSLCQDIKININIPVSIEEKYLYKYNPYSDYYNDEYYSYISKYIINNTLINRKTEFNNKYLSLCEINCKYNGYNLNTKKVICECQIKNQFSLLSEILNNKNNLLYKFILEADLDECSIDNFFNHKCFFKNTTKQQIINKIRENIINHKIDKLLNDILFYKSEDLLVNNNDIIYHITSTQNQKNSKNLNISILDLKECENKLKSRYNISNNTSLIIFKIDYLHEEINIPIVEYEIYHPITKQPLDLNICQNYPIAVSYPVSIDENEIFIYDMNSDYFNDKCFPYTTGNKTDITLNDRKIEFNNNNISLCEKNCNFIDYDKETKRTSCECEPKTIFENIIDYKIDKDKLIQKFTDFKSTTNIDVIFCYKTFFCVNGIKTNIGSYILMIIILINGILCGIFIKKEYIEIDNQMKNIYIIYYKEPKNNLVDGNKIKSEYEYKEKKRKKVKNRRKKKLKKDNNKINIFNKKSYESPPKKGKNKFKKYIKKILNSIIKDSSSKGIMKDSAIFLKKKSTNKIINIKYNNEYKVRTFIDKEINSLNYENALKYDKRSYIKYYISLLKLKHLLIFTFITKNDYNSRSIKICHFSFSFSLFYTINSFFFQDKTIHKIYEDKGMFDFIYQIPQIIYSTIISSTLTLLIKYLSLSDSTILTLKKNNYYDNNNDSGGGNGKDNINENIKSYSKMRKCLIIKFIIFYIITFVLLLVFWYYLGCFCAVFKNTQTYIIKDTLLSFLLSFIYPFILNLIPGIFRIPALKAKGNKKCIYIISKIIQLF